MDLYIRISESHNIVKIKNEIGQAEWIDQELYRRIWNAFNKLKKGIYEL